jgi:hypothetical protein
MSESTATVNTARKAKTGGKYNWFNLRMNPTSAEMLETSSTPDKMARLIERLILMESWMTKLRKSINAQAPTIAQKTQSTKNGLDTYRTTKLAHSNRKKANRTTDPWLLSQE